MRRLLAIVLITFAASTAVAKPREAERFNAWLDAVWEETLVRQPLLATSIGDPRYNDRIVDFTTAAWRADNRRVIERQLRELKGFNRTALSGQDRLSYDILKLELEESLEGLRFPGLDAAGRSTGRLAQLSGADGIGRIDSAIPHDEGL